jgi:hypothetical protein
MPVRAVLFSYLELDDLTRLMDAIIQGRGLDRSLEAGRARSAAVWLISNPFGGRREGLQGR